MFGTLILRIAIASTISNFDLKSTEYVNILRTSGALRASKLIDGVNTILIFFSLFYYSSLVVPMLQKISDFFIKISGEILNLSLLLMFMNFVFSILFHSFYEKNISTLLDFSNTFIAVLNLSLGNQFLFEDDDLISEQGALYYYLVCWLVLTIVLDCGVHLDVPDHARLDLRHHRERIHEQGQESKQFGGEEKKR